MDSLRVIADDLTGACDVGAELLPWPGGVAVRPDPSGAPPERGSLVVVNTQSRTLAPSHAAARVRAVLDGTVPPAWAGILLKKLDTGLRGPLGAELDAAMDAVGAAEAFVLPAIPEVGRTTEGGRQLIDGVPVHETAFARDPQNPVADASVAAVLAATGRRAVGVVDLAAVAAAGGVAAAVAAVRAAGAAVLVCDARSDDDLAHAVRALLGRPRPLVLAGSIGLARALRAALGDVSPPAEEPAEPAGEEHSEADGRGVLVVVGSAHPTSRAQVAHALEAGLVEPLRVALDRPAVAGAKAQGRLAAGGAPLLLAPDDPATAGSAAVLAALRTAAVAALEGVRPRGLVLMGGETAHAVLGGLGHPPLALRCRLAPLAVASWIAAGPWAGVAVATKGGSSGPPALLADIVRRLGAGGS